MAGSSRRPRLALAASPGGHIDLLVALAPAFDEYERTWLLPRGSRFDALRARGERTLPLRLFAERRMSLLGNVFEALVGLLVCRPQIVVTSGAGVVVPFCLLARLCGAKLVFIETMARVRSGSATGRFLTRFSAETLVQWPESLAVYPGARVCSPVLLVPESTPASERAGTFVALGTHWQPFTRLMRTVERAAAEGLLPQPIVAQVGEFSYPTEHMSAVASVSPERLGDLMRTSQVVICHGGAGIIATALRAGRHPLALARQSMLGEHIDDHQHEIVDKLSSLDLLTRIEGTVGSSELASAGTDVSGRLPLPGQPMTAALSEILSELSPRGT